METSTKYLGRYLSDVFLIEFPSSTRIFNKGVKQRELTSQEYGTFLHEYWHYLINISTFARIKDFTLFYHIVSIFSKTLTENADGTSVGLDYNSEDRKVLAEILELRLAYQGGFYEKINTSYVYDFHLTGEVIISDYNLTLYNRLTPVKKVSIPIKAITENGEKNGYFILGNHAIEESIVNAIERTVYDDGKSPLVNPYLVLTRIFEYYSVGIKFEREEIAILGTLSLLTSDPAVSVVRLIKDFCSYRQRIGTKEALIAVTNEINPIIEQISPFIYAQVESLQGIYKDREPLCFAINYITQKILYCFELRRKDLLFDLTPILTRDKKLLEDLIFNKVKPCDILQRFRGCGNKIGKDLLKSFELEKIIYGGKEWNISFFLQLFYCQLDYVQAHGMVGIFPSDKVKSKCPYYSVCSLDFRKSNPTICKTKPWKQFNKNTESCMYGTAVSNLIGLVKSK